MAGELVAKQLCGSCNKSMDCSGSNCSEGYFPSEQKILAEIAALERRREFLMGKLITIRVDQPCLN